MKLNKATELLNSHFIKWMWKNPIEEIENYNLHKLRHSVWVLEVWRMILVLIWKEINSKLRKKCELIFLLHDLGRFYQNNWERLLNWKEFDHWEKSYEIMKKEWFLAELNLAVKYHDKISYTPLFKEKEYLKLNWNEKSETIFLTKILRDADKLQNMIYQLYDFETIFGLNKSRWFIDWDLSPEVLNSLKKNELINFNNVKTKCDYMSVYLAWYFDINFLETKKILKDYNYIWRTLSLIKNTKISEKDYKEIKEIFKIYI